MNRVGVAPVHLQAGPQTRLIHRDRGGVLAQRRLGARGELHGQGQRGDRE